MKVCGLVLSLALLLSSTPEFTRGVVEISPSPVAPVCQEGVQLELMCNTTSGLDHRWEFTVVPENASYTTRRPISLTGVSGIPTTPLSIGNSMITFSRLSGPNILPLISRITISPVSRGLNGTVVSCFELATNSVATTTIQIIDTQQFGLSIRSDPEDFSSDGITVNLEWTLLNSQIYYQQFLHNVSVSVNPQPKNVMFTGNTRVLLKLSYNTPYIVNVTQHSTYRQLNRTKILELNFNKCGDPMEQTTALAEGYVDPALEGRTVTFICPRGQILNGSNSSTCMGNGEWEPDPREVECTGTPVTTTTSVVTTAIGMIAMLRTTLITVTCVSVVMSLFTFITGIVCYHCISQRWRALSADINKQPESHNIPKDTESELQLKENVAYITLRPAT